MHQQKAQTKQRKLASDFSRVLASSSDAEHEPLLPKQTHLLGCLQVFFSIFLAAMGAAQAQLFFPGGRLPACASDVWQR